MNTVQHTTRWSFQNYWQSMMFRVGLLAIVAASLAMLSVHIVEAGYSDQFSSLGCDYNQGRTYRPYGGSTMQSYTVSQPTGGVPCGWGYVSGYFYDGSNTYNLGPGWEVPTAWIVDTDTYSDVVSATAAHSACMAGGPCTGATFKNSSE